MAPLDPHQDTNPAAVVFENTVDQEEGIRNKLLLPLDLLYDLKEKPDVLLSFVFLIISH